MKKQSQLFVIATTATVHELSPEGDFVSVHGQPRRVVGKVYNDKTGTWDVVPEGQLIHYHAEYIRHLKEGSLLPFDAATAMLAGVALPFSNKQTSK